MIDISNRATRADPTQCSRLSSFTSRDLPKRRFSPAGKVTEAPARKAANGTIFKGAPRGIASTRPISRREPQPQRGHFLVVAAK